ncbi:MULTISPECIES: ESX secretion-associated protein EspG [Mycobacterium ulcerans group]|uniref:Conserved protein n=1 Tax=Mycobacterium marinum DL240490 TaxID=459420 RepID=B6CLM4_MYCMR|nr:MULTISPECIES: ESX secretion-associated protein EspG [Mycobacterium ulcerans group]ACA50948.1 conserved protein [Mycobacterium marinum DL240490]MBC9862678.1 hypothetical protein [Mycobacterium pseudoshottsii]UZK92667.1 ESX secretion-associated protein EspG [Mycobacterium ulcerans]GAQ32795.1 hypothetical protein MPS_1175 [Mycobacterium pseudoshottsii JCM 15466]
MSQPDTATAARLSTTSEGLWLTAALCNVAKLPPALKIRPIGSVQATITDHPGIEALENAGICGGGVVDPDVAAWVTTLGRPDIEVDVVATRREMPADRLAGPPAIFAAPDDAVAAAEALAQWHAQRPPQRVVALCRRDNTWVAAARLWSPGHDGCDDVVVSPVNGDDIAQVVIDALGPADPARFHGINSEAAALATALTTWQANPNIDIVTSLVERVGLSVPQARVVEASADDGATRAAITATQFSIDGPALAPHAVTVADTTLGRVVVSTTVGPDGRKWTTLLPGSEAAIRTAAIELLETLPSGLNWRTHQRT